MTRDTSGLEALIEIAKAKYSPLNPRLLMFIPSPSQRWPWPLLLPCVAGLALLFWGLARHDCFGMVIGLFILLGAPWALACALETRIIHLERRLDAVAELLDQQQSDQ